MKKLITTIAAMILITLLGASCSREVDVKTTIPDVLKQDKINPNEIFTLTRSGHIVKVKWHIDLSACDRIEISRSETGSTNNRTPVARLDEKQQSHDDIVPTAGPFWYWIRVWPPKSEAIFIGPLRIGPDVENVGAYGERDKKYKFQVSRNETNVKISWDIPKENLKHITIRRNTSTLASKRSTVASMVFEWAGQINDVLPDHNADYWYWMTALLEDGTIINRGPMKAEYRED